MKGYPRWFTRILISSIIGTSLLTGIFLIPTSLEMRFELNPVWRLNGDMRLFIVGIHALVAFCVAILIGALWSLHMRQEWRRKRNRLTGVTSAGSILLLILSGVGLYYLSNETLIRWTSGMHSILGLMLALVYCVHLALA